MPSTSLTAESTLGKLIAKNKTAIASILPKHITPERIARVALMEARDNAKLMQCDPLSFIGAVMESARLGLEPGGALGEAYMIPYGRECQFQIGYQGLMTLARRSKEVTTFDAQVVYEDDEFSFQYGTNAFLYHTPGLRNRGEPIAVYAVAGLVGNVYQFVVMTIEEVEEHRKMSKTRGGPWKDHWEAMAKKTAIKALCKFLPRSTEIVQALAHEGLADRGVSQGLDDRLKTDWQTVDAVQSQTRVQAMAGLLEGQVGGGEDQTLPGSLPDETKGEQ